MRNHKLLEKFYAAFKNGDAKTMSDCYHQDVEFEDPAFGLIGNGKPAKMWEMLLSSKEAAPQVTFTIIAADENTGQAEWTAEYFFGPDKRKVINNVKANFVFEDGIIISHKDNFNFWKWSQQAIGPIGYIMGWTPFMKSKVQNMANQRLNKFISQ